MRRARLRRIGAKKRIAATVPKDQVNEEHRLRLRTEQLAMLMKLLDYHLPYPPRDERWWRHPEKAAKYRAMRELRNTLETPSARGRRRAVPILAHHEASPSA